ncbi:MAG: TetR/AcrR family transcriptional regulator [Acutalibacteraceae bacterium]
MDRRVLRTKRMLKDALLELLKDSEIEEITISELCRKADVNRNTFYAHYSVPADLLREIEDDLVSSI